MRPSTAFLMFLILKVSYSKTHQKHMHEAKSMEGDQLIEKILASDRFHELADKIVDRAIEKINNQQSSAINADDSEIETKKSNFQSNTEFKTIQDSGKSDTKSEKKSRKIKKINKPGRIDIEAVMQKKIVPSDDLAFRYNRFTRGDRTAIESKKTPKPENVERASEFNLPNDKEESTKHKVIKKPSANKNSEELNKSGTATDEESKSVENKRSAKSTPNDLSVESTKIANADFRDDIKLRKNDNPFGNEKVIIWNGKNSDSGENDNSEIKSETKHSGKTKKTSRQVTARITEGKTESVKDIPHLFRAETISTTSPKDISANEVDDINNTANDDDDTEKNSGNQKAKTEELEKNNKSTTKQIIRREGDRTYILKDSSDYQEYHEQLAKMRKNIS